MSFAQTYLGDSVYAHFDDWHVVLTTNNGLGASNTIYLDPHVFAALLRYHESLMDAQARAQALDLALDEGGGLVLTPEDLEPPREAE